MGAPASPSVITPSRCLTTAGSEGGGIVEVVEVVVVGDGAAGRLAPRPPHDVTVMRTPSRLTDRHWDRVTISASAPERVVVNDSVSSGRPSSRVENLGNFLGSTSDGFERRGWGDSSEYRPPRGVGRVTVKPSC